ncbi:MAG: amidohydrolase family protein [Deltaproteobacteria bacterium]|nr:amidohydrolase family protein [Deltaproteobacteria bacterium]
MTELRVVNGQVFIPGSGFFDLDVGVNQGKISVLARRGDLPEADQTVDAQGKLVIPGVIDPHIHLGIFNDFEKECETETRAALAGGVTTVGMFMGGEDSYLQQLGGLIETFEQKASTDLIFHLSIFTDQQMAEMDEYQKQFGVTSFKFYMAGVKGVFPGVSDSFIYEGFKKVAAMGERATACIHCEDQSMLDSAFERVSQENPKGTLADWADTAPNMAEEQAIMRAYYLAEKAGNKLYIVHISTKEGIERFAELRKQGTANAFGETTSPYLSVNKHDSLGLLCKMVPPLRDEQDIDSLWERVRDETIASFGTDNVSLNRAVKQAEKGMLEAMPGYPVLQTHLPVLLTEGYHKRNIPLETILTRATINPARIYGIYPQKGTISIGSDADLVVLDLEKERTVKSDELFSYSDFSIYEGKTLKGWPSVVVKGGQVAYKDGEIIVEPGCGSYLRREL